MKAARTQVDLGGKKDLLSEAKALNINGEEVQAINDG